MSLLVLLACVTTDPGLLDDTGPDTPDPAHLCPNGAPRSSAKRDVHGFVYGDGETNPLEGVSVTPCGEPSPVGMSDAAGSWVVSMDDLEWVVIEQVHDERVPNRCVFDPVIEGGDPPYRIGMGGWDTENFPMEHLGITPEPGTTWVDVDALDDLTGLDLAGATIDITAPYEAAVTQDPDGTFIQSNVTNGIYDILFANVALVPFDIVVTHPDKPECRVPGTMVGRGNDQLNMSVYCR
ncbi:MAG: hypothetical protein Q8P18_29650 [Pseudomonadota bacterium]|nr:hypothetical protein [Pseudomonadota bacterium]